MSHPAASSRTPRQVVEDGYAAWNTGDRERFMEIVHPEIVWTTSGLFPGLRPAYSGEEEVREFLEEFQEPWETLQIEIQRLVELDHESLLVLVRFHARGRDGIEVERELANHLVIRDERLYRFKAFPSWEVAMAELDSGGGSAPESAGVETAEEPS